jgi:predicted RNA-binding Zn-ribbon protein involved in translation (DUF1610 family)
MEKEQKKETKAKYDEIKCAGCGATFSVPKAMIAKNCPECGLLIMR